jgi:flagellar basal body-associated protein FliL
MKKARLLFIVVVSALIMVHIGVFVQSMKLSSEIDRLEVATKTARQKNIDLEAYVYKLGSLSTTASDAAALGFGKSKNTLFLTDTEVAHRP